MILGTTENDAPQAAKILQNIHYGCGHLIIEYRHHAMILSNSKPCAPVAPPPPCSPG